MNTFLDVIESDNRARASRHLASSDRPWWIAGIAAAIVFVLFWVFAAVAAA